jgi:hypothetical protein
MKNRIIGFFVASALAAAGVWLPAPLSAQSPASRSATAARPAAPGKYSPPRLADGHPDLQGTFNVATITPIERPQNVTSLTISDDEAAKAEKYLAERRVKENAASDPNRAAPRVGGDNSAIGGSQLEFLERAGGGAVGGYNTFWLASGDRVVEIDGQKRSSIVVDPANGRVPQMKPEAAARNRALRAITVNPDAAEGATAGPAGQLRRTGTAAARRAVHPRVRIRPPGRRRCRTTSTTTSSRSCRRKTRSSSIEMVHDARIIRMNARTCRRTSAAGWATRVGHWEGDTLVVDTTNFTNKTQFHGSAENLHVIERFTRVDANTLLYRFTSTIRRRGIGRGAASIPGLRLTSRSTSTRATKATTRWAASCAAHASKRRIARSVRRRRPQHRRQRRGSSSVSVQHASNEDKKRAAIERWPPFVLPEVRNRSTRRSCRARS